MAKKKNIPTSNTGNIKKTTMGQRPELLTHNSTNKTKKLPKYTIHLLIVSCIGALTWLVLKICLENQITNWDDPGYLQDNPIIKDLTAGGLKHIFSEPVMGNYHPFTILSYALEYVAVQFDPRQYHLDSLLLHVADTVLVYWLVFLLSKRHIAAAVAALLFGLHPMHVESLAWISGRKDVLYSLFYLGSCIVYVYYLETKAKRKWTLYGILIVLYLCALFSKPVAVTLPLTLLLIDYLDKRKWNIGIIFEKIPLFLLSIVFGVIALKVQHSAGAMDMQKIVYTPLERIALGGYALITYLWKSILPVHLCNYYPYPQKVNGLLPAVYYIYPALALAFIFLAWQYARKNRVMVFGLLFFIANIVLLLQFIQVGDAILADRYTYIPYLGLFYIAGWWVSGFFEPGGEQKFRYTVASVFAVYLCCLCYASNRRCQVWADPISLWRDEIDKEAGRATIAFNNLGYIYAAKYAATQDVEDKKVFYDSAHYLLNKAVELQPDFVNPYVTIGDLERNSGHYDEALKNYYRIMHYKDKEPNIYLGLAILYSVLKNQDSAGHWFRAAIRINPKPESHSNYGNFLYGQAKYDSAIKEYNVAIAGNDFNYVPYMNRGECYKAINQLDSAINDFNKAIKLSPETGEIYYRRSFSYTQKGDKTQALQDVEKAISLGFTQVDDKYYTFLRSKP